VNTGKFSVLNAAARKTRAASHSAVDLLESSASGPLKVLATNKRGSNCKQLRLQGIQNAKGQIFARRVQVIDENELTRNGQNRTCTVLRKAIDLVQRGLVGGRLVVPIDVATVPQEAGDYLRALMETPELVRRQLMLEIRGTEFGVCSALGEFCTFAQSRAGVGMMLHVEEGSDEDIDSQMFVTSASILCLGKRMTERTRPCKHRIEVLDAIEIAQCYGACVMMEGIDTENEMVHVFKLGVTLASGPAVCQDLTIEWEDCAQRLTTPQEFVSRITMMA
jgi:hypothetical protein